MSVIISRIFVASIVLLNLGIIACGSKENDSATEDFLATPATFTMVQEEIFQPSCAFSSCHGSGAGYLLLDGESDYDNLVNASSANRVGEILVIPNDVETSYLWRKCVSGQNITGGYMAPNVGISERQEAILRSWIEDGAQNN